MYFLNKTHYFKWNRHLFIWLFIILTVCIISKMMNDFQLYLLVPDKTIKLNINYFHYTIYTSVVVCDVGCFFCIFIWYDKIYAIILLEKKYNFHRNMCFICGRDKKKKTIWQAHTHMGGGGFKYIKKKNIESNMPAQ